MSCNSLMLSGARREFMTLASLGITAYKRRLAADGDHNKHSVGLPCSKRLSQMIRDESRYDT